jgi:hypothetical protein
MDVWALLNWLWQQIDKVLDWFGSSYNSLRNAAAHALEWAITYAAQAYNSAKAYIIDRVNAVISFANWILDYLSAYATDLYHEAINFARSVLSTAYAAVNDAIDYVIDVATNLYHAALDRIVRAINDVEAWASDQIDAARHIIEHIFNPLLPLLGVMSVLLSLTTQDAANKLLTFIRTLYGQIVQFFDDPLGFVLGLIWTQAVTFFCYVLGYGLGSVNATLPPIPVWGKGLGGGGPLPPPIPPIPGSELVRPVEPLYVSGYTFHTGHYGTDFGIADGQIIRAAHSGVISFAGWDNTGYGNRIDISGEPYWTRYGHNKQILVTVGQQVSAGEVIAYGNSTGNSTGSHLHFELKINGSYVDPVLYL